MYAYFKGIIADKEAESVVVDCNGIGYNIKVSVGTSALLPGIGDEVKLFTYTSVREDDISLYGFLTKEELDFFKLLINVNGIGPKGGQSILSVLSVRELRLAILGGDSKKISSAPGIGAKTAQRIILDMKDKLHVEDGEDLFGDESVTMSLQNLKKNEKDAIDALIALGYGSAEAAKAVRSVVNSEEMGVEQLLKASLKNLF